MLLNSAGALTIHCLAVFKAEPRLLNGSVIPGILKAMPVMLNEDTVDVVSTLIPVACGVDGLQTPEVGTGMQPVVEMLIVFPD